MARELDLFGEEVIIKAKRTKQEVFEDYEAFCKKFDNLFKKEVVWIQYSGNDHWLFAVENCNQSMSKIQRLEDVVERALTTIENKEWS